MFTMENIGSTRAFVAFLAALIVGGHAQVIQDDDIGTGTWNF